jgi:hypothetical protein
LLIQSDIKFDFKVETNFHEKQIDDRAMFNMDQYENDKKIQKLKGKN